jgi:hypothetical protein
MEAPLETKKIELGEDTIKNLDVIRKWTMFFSILGFIFLALFIIIGIITSTFLSTFKTGGTPTGIPESIVIIAFIVLAILYFFPVHFLFKFSKHTAHAVQTHDNNEMHKAIKNLKAYFVYLGILIIIGLALYLVLILATGSSLSFFKGS